MNKDLIYIIYNILHKIYIASYLIYLVVYRRINKNKGKNRRGEFISRALLEI